MRSHICGQALVFFSVLASLPAQAETKMSPSDLYCARLQLRHANALKVTDHPSTIEQLIGFVNSLMQNLVLEDLEREAIKNKMTFEDFQKWANNKQPGTVSDKYQPQYLEKYLKTVCGTITNSATWSVTTDPDLNATAEKQFDPKGHAYAEEDAPTAPPPANSPPEPSNK